MHDVKEVKSQQMNLKLHCKAWEQRFGAIVSCSTALHNSLLHCTQSIWVSVIFYRPFGHPFSTYVLNIFLSGGTMCIEHVNSEQTNRGTRLVVYTLAPSCPESRRKGHHLLTCTSLHHICIPCIHSYMYS